MIEKEVETKYIESVPPPAKPSLTLGQVWMRGLLRTNIQSYSEIAMDTRATLSRTIKILLATLFIAGVVRIGIVLILAALYPDDIYEALDIDDENFQTLITFVVFDALFRLVIITLFFIGLVWFTHFIAQSFLGGQGEVHAYAYVFGAFFIPVIALQYGIVFIAPIFGIFAFFFFPFANFVALKSVYHMDAGRTLIASLPLVVYIFLSFSTL